MACHNHCKVRGHINFQFNLSATVGKYSFVVPPFVVRSHCICHFVSLVWADYLPILVLLTSGKALRWYGLGNSELCPLVGGGIHFNAVVSALIFRSWFRVIGMRARGWQHPLHRSLAAQCSPVFLEVRLVTVLSNDFRFSFNHLIYYVIPQSVSVLLK